MITCSSIKVWIAYYNIYLLQTSRENEIAHLCWLLVLQCIGVFVTEKFNSCNVSKRNSHVLWHCLHIILLFYYYIVDSINYFTVIIWVLWINSWEYRRLMEINQVSISRSNHTSMLNPLLDSIFFLPLATYMYTHRVLVG